MSGAKVDAGEVADRSAYEISKVADKSRQRDLATKATNGMTLKEMQTAVRKRPVKAPRRVVSKRLEFSTEHGWRVIAVAPHNSKGALITYHHLKEALDHVMEDVQARINSNIRIT